MEIYDAVIVGSGIAGLTNAIYLKEAGLNIVVITKSDDISDTNTNHAQGGIVSWRENDNKKSLYDDIMNAGANYNSKDAVQLLVDQGPKLVFDFLIDKIGISFSTDQNGKLDYTEEAAHSIRRILHYQDHTGDRIQKSLVEYAKHIGINIITNHSAIDLISNNHNSLDSQEIYKPNEIMGLYALDNETGKVKTFLSNNVVLATGGIGNLYRYTTNPKIATGDGMSMAYRAGANILNAEYIQFHPTLLFHKDIQRFLISESLRGEGAKLLDHNGNEFMHKYSPQKELAPRDIVARAIYKELYKNEVEYLYLDLANNYNGQKPIKERFSKIYQTCLEGGIDISKEPIPIVPAAHYFCGGVKVDLAGKTTIPNLYAIGEVSCTGVQGANRLASISLLEGLLWGKLSAMDIINTKKKISKERFKTIPNWKSPSYTEEVDALIIDQDWKTIKLTMWNFAGIIRTQKGLSRAQSDLNYLHHRILRFYNEVKVSKDIIELRNAIINAQIIVDSAISNTKSIGCHYYKEQD